jgi:serine/threonine protein kinase
MRALLVSDRERFLAGTRVGDDGRYEIRERIGKGAMADVYRAVDRRLTDGRQNTRVVAVKVLSPNVESHEHRDRLRSLFIEEAFALSRVKDDNVVAVLDSGVTPGGTPYMVMEFLDGQDLAQVLKSEKTLPIERAVDIILGVCAGVHACHLAGIIHRDLKPANIFLDLTLKGEQPKVLDFSVAKIPLAGSEVEKESSRTDLIVGTPTYMSPEQAIGKPANALSDQYSVGALLYRCLTGRIPHGVIPRPRDDRGDIPEGLEAAILRAMDARPEGRFPSVFELGRALEPFASPAGRGRWMPYYTTPPIALRSVVTGPISVAAPPPAAAAAKGDVSPTTVQPYDFRAHERTTRVNGGASPEGTTTTVDPQGPSTVGAAPPTTLEKPTRQRGPDRGVARKGSSSGAASAGAAGPSSTRGRRARRSQRIIVAGAVGVAILIVGAAAGMRAWQSRGATPAPLPPAWTHTTTPSGTNIQPPTAPVPPSDKPAPIGAPTPLPVTPASPGGAAAAKADQEREAQDGLAPTSAAAAQTKHRKRTARPAVQYTKDGVPLLSPE